MTLAGSTVVVVGGSSGIGLATARRAAAEGARVIVASRSPERAEIDAEKVQLDVTDEEAVRRLFAGLGPIDHLVSTVTRRGSAPVKELDLDTARAAFETKLFGALALVKHADVRRSITLLSGAAAWTPMSGGAATAAVNGAVAALVRTLAVELAPVRVNAVSPGIVNTPTWDALPAERRRVDVRAPDRGPARPPRGRGRRPGGRRRLPDEERLHHRRDAPRRRRPPAGGAVA